MDEFERLSKGIKEMKKISKEIEEMKEISKKLEKMESKGKEEIITGNFEGEEAYVLAKNQGDGYSLLLCFPKINLQTFHAILDKSNIQGLEVVATNHGDRYSSILYFSKIDWETLCTILDRFNIRS